jgi:hypothetical protein
VRMCEKSDRLQQKVLEISIISQINAHEIYILKIRKKYKNDLQKSLQNINKQSTYIIYPSNLR